MELRPATKKVSSWPNVTLGRKCTAIMESITEAVSNQAVVLPN